MVRAEGVAPST